MSSREEEHQKGDREEPENFEDWEDSEEEDFDDEYDDEVEGEEGDEEEEPERVSFDRSALPPVSREARDEHFTKMGEIKRARQDEEKRRKLVFSVVLPVVLTIAIVAAMGMAARRLYIRGQEAAAKATRPPRNALLAGGTAVGEKADQGVAEMRDQFLGRRDLPVGAAGEAMGPAGPGGDDIVIGQEEVNLRIAEAQQLLKEGRLADARRTLQKAVILRPDVADLYIVYGATFLVEDPAQSRANAVKALQLENGSEGALELLGRAFETQRSRGLSPRDEIALLELQLGDYENALEARPDWPELLFSISSQRITLYRLDANRKEELETAIGELQRAVPLWEIEEGKEIQLASAHHQLGRALRYQGDELGDSGAVDEAAARYDRALAEFAAGLALDANRFDTLGQMILVHRSRKEDEKAIEAVLGHLPKAGDETVRARMHGMVAALYQERGEEEKAIAEFEKALEINPRLAGPYLSLAKLYWGREDAARAEQMLTRSTAVFPNFLDGYVTLGQIYTEIGRDKEAITIFERALQIPPERAVMVSLLPSRNAARNRKYYLAAGSLAWLYLEEENDTEKARNAANLAQRFGKPGRQLADTIGWIHYKEGNYEKAEEVLTELIGQTGGFAGAHYHLAASYLKQGKKAEALREVEKALAGDDPFPEREDAEKLREKMRGGGE